MTGRVLATRIVVGTLLPGLAVLGARMAWNRIGPTPSATDLIAKSSAWAQHIGGIEIRSESNGLDASNRTEVLKATGRAAFKNGRYLYWTEQTLVGTTAERGNYGDERGRWEQQPKGCWAFAYGPAAPWGEFTFDGQVVPPLGSPTITRHGSRIELRGIRPDGHSATYTLDRSGRVYAYTYELDQPMHVEVHVTITKQLDSVPEIAMPAPSC